MVNLEQNKGFTLIELLTTLAVAAVLASIAAPNLNASVQSMKVQSMGEDLLMALQRARSEALRLGSRVTVCPSNDSATCDTAAGWANGWLTFNDINANGVVDTGEDILAVDKANNPLLFVTTSSGLKRSVSFLASGRTATNSGEPLSGVIRICSSSEAISNEKRARDLVVTSTGRTALTTSAHAVPPTCPAP